LRVAFLQWVRFPDGAKVERELQLGGNLRVSGNPEFFEEARLFGPHFVFLADDGGGRGRGGDLEGLQPGGEPFGLRLVGLGDLDERGADVGELTRLGVAERLDHASEPVNDGELMGTLRGSCCCHTLAIALDEAERFEEGHQCFQHLGVLLRRMSPSRTSRSKSCCSQSGIATLMRALRSSASYCSW
jgi:hypothetical protein